MRLCSVYYSNKFIYRQIRKWGISFSGGQIASKLPDLYTDQLLLVYKLRRFLYVALKERQCRESFRETFHLHRLKLRSRQRASTCAKQLNGSEESSFDGRPR